MIHIEPIPAFQDNYLWLIRQEGRKEAAVVDPGDPEPVQRYLEQHKLSLAAILVTHHHMDHIGGVEALRNQWQCPVYGPDSPKIPQVTHRLHEDDEVEVAGLSLRILEVPGHTLEHIAFYGVDDGGSPLVFCGDTLFAAGCGRMFEGTAPVMYASLQKLAALPAATRVFCTHEYTLSNLKFARAVLKDRPALLQRLASEQAKRDASEPTLPSTISLELQTNPFLHCTDPEVLAVLARERDHHNPEPHGVFGALRSWKDRF